MIAGGSEHQELSGVEVKPISEWFSSQYKWLGAVQAHGRLLEIWKMLWSEEVVLTLKPPFAEYLMLHKPHSHFFHEAQ